MWFLKKTAQNVWNASKNFVDNRTPTQKLIDSIAESQQQILPTNKLNELAAMTYDMQAFDEILEMLTKKLKIFHYDSDEANKTLNLLIATNYLIKHGATGFVDEFREYIGVFKKYQSLKQVKVYEDERVQQNLDYSLEKIKSRAQHITVLLEDKHKLLKEKELSMLVKQKLKLYEKSKLSELKNEKYSNSDSRGSQKNENKNPSQGNTNFMESQNISGRLQGLLQRYVWKYVDKLDDTIENASEKIMEQIDKYVLGEQPSPFELEQAEKFQEEEGERNPKNMRKDQDEDLMQKLEEESKDVENMKVQHANLLDFQEVEDSGKQTKKNEAEVFDNLLD